MQPHTLYPLLFPDTYDDEDQKGFTHVLFNVEKGDPLLDTYHTADAWPCTPEGKVHPDYVDPVPVRVEDVDMKHPIPLPGSADLPVASWDRSARQEPKWGRTG